MVGVPATLRRQRRANSGQVPVGFPWPGRAGPPTNRIHQWPLVIPSSSGAGVLVDFALQLTDEKQGRVAAVRGDWLAGRSTWQRRAFRTRCGRLRRQYVPLRSTPPGYRVAGCGRRLVPLPGRLQQPALSAFQPPPRLGQLFLFAAKLCGGLAELGVPLALPTQKIPFGLCVTCGTVARRRSVEHLFQSLQLRLQECLDLQHQRAQLLCPVRRLVRFQQR